MPVESRTRSGRLLRVIPDVTWWRANEKFEHGFCLSPAFRDDVGMSSGRSDDNYGRHTADLEMYVRGPLGAVQFKMFTGWDIEDVEGSRWGRAKSWNNSPTAADLGYHKRLDPDHAADEWAYITDECSVLDGARCQYDGSGLNAEPVMELLVRSGHTAVFEYLEGYYRATFDGEEWPTTPFESDDQKGDTT